MISSVVCTQLFSNNIIIIIIILQLVASDKIHALYIIIIYYIGKEIKYKCIYGLLARLFNVTTLVSMVYHWFQLYTW